LNNIGTFSKNITLVVTMIFGGTLVVNQTITIGEFFLITYYTNMCLSYSEYFLKLGQEYQHAKISYDRLEEFLDIEDENNGTLDMKIINKIEVEDLSFSYPEGPLLISDFRFKNGEGKSTLIDLLLGLDYNFGGTIKYNNLELKKLDMINIRKNCISVVTQEPRMQRLSVLDNLVRGLENYSKESFSRLNKLFDLDSLIDLEESIALSGGEKQKVSIVRGFLKSPSLLIMDEPVSALDVSSVQVLKEELLKYKENVITIIVSHNEILFDIVDEFIELPKTQV